MRMAHEIVGRLVREAESKGQALCDLPEDLLKAAHPNLTKEKVPGVLGTTSAVQAFASERSTGPPNVTRALQSWKNALALRDPIPPKLFIQNNPKEAPDVTRPIT